MLTDKSSVPSHWSLESFGPPSPWPRLQLTLRNGDRLSRLSETCCPLAEFPGFAELAAMCRVKRADFSGGELLSSLIERMLGVWEKRPGVFAILNQVRLRQPGPP